MAEVQWTSVSGKMAVVMVALLKGAKWRWWQSWPGDGSRDEVATVVVVARWW